MILQAGCKLVTMMWQFPKGRYNGMTISEGDMGENKRRQATHGDKKAVTLQTETHAGSYPFGRRTFLPAWIKTRLLILIMSPLVKVAFNWVNIWPLAGFVSLHWSLTNIHDVVPNWFCMTIWAHLAHILAFLRGQTRSLKHFMLSGERFWGQTAKVGAH